MGWGEVESVGRGGSVRDRVGLGGHRIASEQVGHPSLPARAAVLLSKLIQEQTLYVTACSREGAQRRGCRVWQ